MFVSLEKQVQKFGMKEIDRAEVLIGMIWQESMIRNMQLHYILVTAFHRPIDFQIKFPWNETSLGVSRLITRKHIDVSASLDLNYLSLTKEMVHGKSVCRSVVT